MAYERNSEGLDLGFAIEDTKAETEKAWCLKLKDQEEDIWFPKSKCRITRGNLVVPEWLAKAKGLVEE